MTSVHSVHRSEIAKFSAMADEWWNPAGPMKPLHAINPVRVNYVQECAGNIVGSSCLDVGCGGGIASESLAGVGATVTGIDASEKLIDVANYHAKKSGIELDYRCTTTDEMLDSHAGAFDLVTAFEVIEHVADPMDFVRQLVTLVKPGGDIVISTINRTSMAFLLAIVGAEYVTGILPRGTHRYDMFIRPEEVMDWANKAGATVRDCVGMSYNPVNNRVKLKPSTSVNYLMWLRRKDA